MESYRGHGSSKEIAEDGWTDLNRGQANSWDVLERSSSEVVLGFL